MRVRIERPADRTYFRSLLQSRPGLIVGCVSYIVLFVVLYQECVVPVWGYEGFRSRASLFRAAVGWILAALPSLWLPSKFERPSQVVYWILYLFVVVPSCLVPTYALDDQSRGPLLLSAAIVGAFAVTGIIYRLPLISLPPMQLRSYEFNMLLLLLSTASYALIVARFGVQLRFVSFEDTYSVRAQFAAIEHAPSAVAYAIGWQAWVINPLIMAIGLRSRRVSWLVTGALGEFAIYSIAAFRSMLFSAGLLVYLIIAMRYQKRFGVRMIALWTALFAGAGAIQLVGWSILPESLLGVRMTALPGLLTGYYYEFFSSHPKALLGHSIFRAFTHYPYAVEPPYLIGATYFHNAANDANAHIWADAYANFGYYGIICFTVLFAGILWMCDSMAVRCDLRLAGLALGLPAFSLANGALLTTMLSNGMGLAMILICIMPQQIYEPRRGPSSVPLRPAIPRAGPQRAMHAAFDRAKSSG